MVEKKKNIFMLVLCFIFAVILPFSFVGCKDKNSPENLDDKPASSDNPSDKKDSDTSNDNNDNDSNGSGNSEQIYTLSVDDVVKIINSSEEKIDEFIDSLNKSKLFEENNVSGTSEFISFTKNVIRHAYYPFYITKDFKEACLLSHYNFELGRLYGYFEDGGNSDYIEFYVENNNRIVINCLSDMSETSSKSLNYYCFDFKINKDEILSLKVSNFYTEFDNKNISFDSAIFDFENSEFTTEIGRIYSFSSNSETYFNKHFSAEKFDTITNWSYIYYSNVKFGETKQFVYKDSNEARDAIKNDFDKLGFLNVFVKFNEFKNFNRIQVYGISNDFIGFVETTDLFSIGFEDYCFKKITK